MVILISARRSPKHAESISSGSSRISTNEIELIVEKLKANQVRPSTSKVYLAIWCSFNKFLIRLDRKPSSWEDRTQLYCAVLIEDGRQSSTVKSYVSAIKAMLSLLNYRWNEKKILLNSLTKACRLSNYHVRARFPIHQRLLEMMLFEVE